MSTQLRKKELEQLQIIRQEGIAAGRRGDSSGLPNAYYGFENREKAETWRDGYGNGKYEVEKESQDAEADDAQYELFKKNMQRFIDERKL